MEVLPSGLPPDVARVFQSPDVARVYHLRPPWLVESLALLGDLAHAGAPQSSQASAGAPRVLRVLDVGTGTGELARPLAACGFAVDALDPSAAMLKTGQRAPGGDAAALTWIRGRAERASLPTGAYALIVCGDSAHLLHGRAFQRFAELLTPSGRVAILAHGVDDAALPWSAALMALQARYTTYAPLVTPPFIPALERRGLFVVEGVRTWRAVYAQSVADYVLSMRSYPALARARMGATSAAAFAQALRVLVERFADADGMLALPLRAQLVWGRPGPASAQAASGVRAPRHRA